MNTKTTAKTIDLDLISDFIEDLDPMLFTDDQLSKSIMYHTQCKREKTAVFLIGVQYSRASLKAAGVILNLRKEA